MDHPLMILKINMLDKISENANDILEIFDEAAAIRFDFSSCKIGAAFSVFVLDNFPEKTSSEEKYFKGIKIMGMKKVKSFKTGTVMIKNSRQNFFTRSRQRSH
eukprot:TRINITY_DN13777_c0_g1_i1.p1 TRINITY_DN13777_c0_g1~~TRINITY_DN13777_c0_g1_i1.p1  ORF type:complete len:103 (+),score=13.38 TRINITY_DN13777_c0_g1_i1:119-427(+)